MAASTHTAPSIEFTPNDHGTCADRLGINTQRWHVAHGAEEAYSRARVRLLLQGEDELERGGFVVLKDTKGRRVNLVAVSNQTQLILPSCITEDGSKQHWKDGGAEMIARLGVRAAVHVEDGADAFAFEGPAPACDLLYALQCIAPGLVVVRWAGKAEAIPPESWIEAHRDLLGDVVGQDKYAELLKARAPLPQDSYDSDDAEGDDWDRYSDYDRYSSHSEPLDYTACSAHDCGYCGRCDY